LKKKPDNLELSKTSLFSTMTEQTGIKDDKRLYGNIITVRIVESEDAVTAKAASSAL